MRYYINVVDKLGFCGVIVTNYIQVIYETLFSCFGRKFKIDALRLLSRWENNCPSKLIRAARKTYSTDIRYDRAIRLGSWLGSLVKMISARKLERDTFRYYLSQVTIKDQMRLNRILQFKIIILLLSEPFSFTNSTHWKDSPLEPTFRNDKYKHLCSTTFIKFYILTTFKCFFLIKREFY